VNQVLQWLPLWSLDQCLSLLRLCHSSLGAIKDPELIQQVTETYKRFKLYDDVLRATNNASQKDSATPSTSTSPPAGASEAEKAELKKKTQPKWPQWKDLEDACRADPVAVVRHLLSLEPGQFEIAKTLTEQMELPKNLLKEIEMRHLEDLLSKGDTITAFRKLEELGIKAIDIAEGKHKSQFLFYFIYLKKKTSIK